MLTAAKGAALVRSLKEAAGLAGPQLVLAVGSPPFAFLRPVATQKELLNQDDIRLLTKWRNQFVTAFLNEFVATEERTAAWLSDTVGPDDSKLLFMVDSAAGKTFGYMGIAYIDWEALYGEADAVVRGAPAPKGTMTAALCTLLSWAQGQLGLKRIGVRVRSDNAALTFYQKVGFVEEKREPLKRIKESGKIVWVEAPDFASPSVELVYMRLSLK